jgi:hypothetical protein
LRSHSCDCGCSGVQDVVINGKVKKHFFSNKRVKNQKPDVYLKNEGVTEKVVIKMLNKF